MFEQMSLFDGEKDFKIDKPIRLIELFGGIGAQAKALENLGVEFEHYKLCEFDKYAVKSYNAVHHTNFKTSDITQISANDLEIVDTDKYCYIMTYSFPCQDLSLAGKQKGMEKGSGTRSGLLWEVERLLNECKELPQVLVMENVAQVHGKKNLEDWNSWLDFLASKGYKNYWQDLNAKNYSMPQNRKRCFMVSILGDYDYTFPEPVELKLKLKDMLEEQVDEKYYLDEVAVNAIKFNGNVDKNKDTCQCVGMLSYPKYIKMHDISRRVYDVNGLSPTVHCCGGGNLEPKVMIKNGTKQGYLEAEIGDGIDLAYPTSKQRRGRVQKGMCQTLTAHGGNLAVMVDNTTNTITEPTAGQFQPKDRDYNKHGTIREEQFEVRKDKIANAVLTGSKKNCVIEPSKIKNPELLGNEPIVCEQRTDEGIRTFKDNICGTLRTIDSCGDKRVIEPNYRIRKFTPRECWRLMGFSDQDFESAQKENSNAQLYKQAGNSIVVNVLMAIFKEMIDK